MDVVGKVLAERYEVREEIGKGGMAQVFKAWDNMLNRNVAIKILKEEFKDDREFVRRFNVEAQAAARISDNHVVAIYDVGYENGLYYIVMEHIEGITLKKYIAEKGKLPWREAAGYAAQICAGLEAAHKNNVIHRDIKPQNIIMTSDGVLKVTDFGIARASNSQATVTTGNTAIGTVHYLSPEQARGGYTDERTDIYSLGVVLYEMLTGRLPFVDESPVAVAIKHIQEPPTPVRDIDPNIPLGMEQIVNRAMNKEKDTRYAHAGDFLRDLNEVLIDPSYIIGISPRTKVETLDDDDIESTRKMPRVDDDAIADYEREKKKREANSRKSRAKRAEEETKLREIDNKNVRRENRKRERRVTIVAIISAVLVVALLGTLFAGLTGGFALFSGGEKIEIPNLVDMNIETARNQYKANFSIVHSETPNEKPAGTILSQTPEAGKKVALRDDIVINVIVSSGKDTANLMNYSGWNAEDAEKALKEAGYQVNLIEQESDSQEKGKVIGQDPGPGSAIQKGGYVTLFVSKGGNDAKESSAPTSSAKPTATASAAPTSSATATATATASSGTGTATASPSSTKTPASNNNTTPDAPSGGQNGNNGTGASAGSNGDVTISD